MSLYSCLTCIFISFILHQIRVTIDYQPGEDVNWRIGVTNMFADALGLAPFKDNFWTTEHQPGNVYSMCCYDNDY